MTGYRRRPGYSDHHDCGLSSIAVENERLIGQGSYRHPESGMVPIAASVEQAVRGTLCYGPQDLGRLLADLPSLEASRRVPTEVRTEVSAEKSLQAAQRLSGEEGHRTIGVLNFASATKPGGGYLTGAVAQEEDLCRGSALYRCLVQASDYYAAHRADDDPFYSHRVIYSPAVPVFRDDASRLMAVPFPVTFLTCPAPNVRRIARDVPARLAQVPVVLNTRAAMILAVAVRHHVDDLVLGAWGCGVFRNEPGEVAAAFKASLAPGGRFDGHFNRVVFAVYDPTPARANFTAFRAAFGQ